MAECAVVSSVPPGRTGVRYEQDPKSPHIQKFHVKHPKWSAERVVPEFALRSIGDADIDTLVEMARLYPSQWVILPFQQPRIRKVWGNIGVRQ